MASYPWKKGMRLRRSEDFRRMWKEGRSWAHPLFVLWVAPHARYDPRFGFVASKKVGKAVHRNRARRLLREAARLLYPQVEPGWDIVLIARPPLVQASLVEVRTTLHLLLRQAGVLREDKSEAT